MSFISHIHLRSLRFRAAPCGPTLTLWLSLRAMRYLMPPPMVESPCPCLRRLRLLTKTTSSGYFRPSMTPRSLNHGCCRRPPFQGVSAISHV